MDRLSLVHVMFLAADFNIGSNLPRRRDAGIDASQGRHTAETARKGNELRPSGYD
jgi:hypothetical protein